ncbi:trimeric LpxA-like protein [Armillaria gallica]|uniref:Trimeric LpxA-like protein n=1 Tax=Armillaria gallica TaxID=47427 RepID=A0A2H3DJC1_ARMGA|nr:trimeric LpxA-like protein [Armillaria gallica]
MEPEPPVAARHRARILYFPTHSGQERKEILAELLNASVSNLNSLYVEPPLYVDYGTNIELKGSFYANYNTTVFYCATITIGTRVYIGPNVSLYAATCGISVKERQTILERTSEIVVGNDCWIGGGDNTQADVVLGQRCTVGTGSIVTKSLPDRCVVSHDSESFVDLSIFKRPMEP